MKKVLFTLLIAAFSFMAMNVSVAYEFAADGVSYTANDYADSGPPVPAMATRSSIAAGEELYSEHIPAPPFDAIPVVGETVLASDAAWVAVPHEVGWRGTC